MVPLQESFSQGLTLRNVRDRGDVEKFVAFNTMVNGKAEGLTCQCLLTQRPRLDYDDYALVVDDATGEVVSCTCLIPWSCRLEGIDLEVAMLEMVVTHPGYRHRGMVRYQVDHYYHPRVLAQSYDLSIIHGIPYYYRQYGYAYALDSDGYDSLPTWRIPDSAEAGKPGVHFRDAGVEDIPLLVDYYQKAMSGLELYTRRDAIYWQYLLEGCHFPVKIVEQNQSNQPAGYIIPRAFSNLRGVDVLENYTPTLEVGLEALRLIKSQVSGEVRLAWPFQNPLVKLARSLGSVPVPAYQWLVRITDGIAFMQKIRPALESRIARSDCTGISAELTINLFRSAFVLSLQNGRVAGCKPAGFVDSSMGADGGDLCIPPDAFTRLVMGYRNLDELRDAWPDIVIKPERRHLLDVLFPRFESYLCVPYHYCRDS